MPTPQFGSTDQSMPADPELGAAALRPDENVRDGSKTEVSARRLDVCFASMSGHRQAVRACPKRAKSRHRSHYALTSPTRSKLQDVHPVDQREQLVVRLSHHFLRRARTRSQLGG
jgi:hypothetical protein